jgi:hypothetical protein
MILRSPAENENGELRHAGMDGRHPGVQDASGDIHVGLDSSTPCWNDGIEESYQRLTEPSTLSIFEGGTKDTKGGKEDERSLAGLFIAISYKLAIRLNGAGRVGAFGDSKSEAGK